MLPKKIRILHVIDELRIGGAEVLLTQIIKALGNKHYQHYVFFFGSDGPLRKLLESSNVFIYRGILRDSIRNPLNFSKTILQLLNNLISFIRRNNIDIVQSHMRPANQLAIFAGKITGVPTFPTIHTPATHLMLKKSKSLNYFNSAINNVSYKMADSIVVVSNEIKELYKNQYSIPDHKFFVLKNGIMPDAFIQNQKTIYTKNENDPTIIQILAVGRLVPIKNFRILIRAAKELIIQGISNFRVLIAGEGPERPSLERLIIELEMEKVISLLGVRSDVMELMLKSDLFVIPSGYEGLSIAMIEAMACGLPIVASDIRGLTDYIQHGINGLIFPLDDHKRLVEYLITLIRDADLRHKLSAEAKRSFSENYDLRENIKPLDALFRSHLQRKQNSPFAND